MKSLPYPHQRPYSVETLERRVLLAGTITGTVFDDRNGNSVRDAGEPGLANQVVFIDINFDGVQQKSEPAAISGSDGSYALSNRPNGIQRVRYSPPVGRRQTIPTTIFRDISVVGGVTNNVNFGSTSTSVVAGVVFNDLNGNGKRDVDESGLGGWTLFIDRNNNGKLDTGERTRVTTSNGAFRFTDLLAKKILHEFGMFLCLPRFDLFVALHFEKLKLQSTLAQILCACHRMGCWRLR